MSSSPDATKDTKFSRSLAPGFVRTKLQRITNLATYRKSLGGLNTRHVHLPAELQDAIRVGQSVTYDFYERYKDVYSSQKLKVRYSCADCGAEHNSNFKHLNKRTRVTAPLCPKCVMKAVTSDEGWRDANSRAQSIVQALPETKQKNAEGVSRFWRENPHKLAQMRDRVIAATQTEETKVRMKARRKHDGRGITGMYKSKWGNIRFDSGYELAFLFAMSKRSDILYVRRGPVIDYVHGYDDKLYEIDFELLWSDGKKTWVEIKVSYIMYKLEGEKVILSKRKSVCKYIMLGGVADEFILLDENNAFSQFGFNMPKSSGLRTLIRVAGHSCEFMKHYGGRQSGLPLAH